MKKFLFVLIGVSVVIKTRSQIYEEARYQLMINYKLSEKYTISFQPEMRVNKFVQNATITLWRLLFIGQWNEKAHLNIGANWFNNWHDYDITGNELRAHIEAGFKDKYGKLTYLNRYRLEYRNFYDVDNTGWKYQKSVFRFRYMINWSRTLYSNEKGQKLTLYIADEVFLNIGATTHFNIYDQNRLGGYLVFRFNKYLSIRNTYWWEYKKPDNYNHQWWIQIGYNI